MLLACPSCNGHLSRHDSDDGKLHICDECGGRLVPYKTLRKDHVRGDYLAELRRQARKGMLSKRPCPHCRQEMLETKTPVTAAFYMTLEVCERCFLVWLDPGEIAKLPRNVIPKGLTESRKVLKKAIAITVRDYHEEQKELQLEREREQKEADGDYGLKAVTIREIPAVLGLPVEVEPPFRRKIPWVTISFLLVNVIVMVLTLGGLWTSDEFGFIPHHWYSRGGLTLLTSMITHANILHLLGNGYFLMVFGDNVEDDLGGRRFIGLLLLSHLTGLMGHLIISPP